MCGINDGKKYEEVEKQASGRGGGLKKSRSKVFFIFTAALFHECDLSLYLKGSHPYAHMLTEIAVLNE